MFLIGVFTISILYPFIYIVAISLSTGFEARAGNVELTPVELTFAAYEHVLAAPKFWMSYLNTFIYTIGGTLMSLAFIIPGAYALSRPQLFGRRFWNLLVAFTMWFNAGLIPFFLNMRDQEFSDTLVTQSYSVETVTAAIIVCSIIPVLMVYSFLQKYFNKGIPLGGKE